MVIAGRTKSTGDDYTMLYRFNRNAAGDPALTADSLDAFTGRVADVRGPVRVTQAVHDAASAELARLAAERATRFSREVPNLDDYRAVVTAHPALARLSRGDVTHDTQAEVA
jgi:hypothetical protein